MAALQKQFGLSLRAWYEVVGGVNFLGFHPDWPDPKTLDPLCVMPLEGIAAELYEIHRDRLDEDAPPGVAVSPDEYHKADISGGPSYAVEFPCPGADGEMLNEWHGTMFVNYLRIAFRWGGFPGFQRCQPDRRWSKHMEMIVRGMLPLGSGATVPLHLLHRMRSVPPASARLPNLAGNG